MVGVIPGSQAISLCIVEDLWRWQAHVQVSWGSGLCSSSAWMGRMVLEGGRGKGYNEGLISSGWEATGQLVTAVSPVSGEEFQTSGD